MRALVSLVVVALVGFAVAAHSAAAGSGQPKNRDLSLSVNLGPASVTADTATDGTAAGVDVSTPSASVDAAASTQADISATADASSPVGEAAVQASASTTDAGVPVRVDAETSTALGSATVQAGTTHALNASVTVKSPVTDDAVATGSRNAGATITISTPGHSTAPDAASPVPSNEGSPGVVAQSAEAAAAAPVPPAGPRPTRHGGRAIPSPRSKGPLAKAVGHAPTAPASLPGVTGSSTGHGFGAVTDVPLAASAWPAPERGPIPASHDGALGSGFSAVGSFAILSALLMLAAPLVGRWLWPAIGLAWQPAFAFLPERPG
jgi:hypothetical protein